MSNDQLVNPVAAIVSIERMIALGLVARAADAVATGKCPNISLVTRKTDNASQPPSPGRY